jgi:hypothetical protein
MVVLPRKQKEEKKKGMDVLSKKAKRGKIHEK